MAIPRTPRFFYLKTYISITLGLIAMNIRFKAIIGLGSVAGLFFLASLLRDKSPSAHTASTPNEIAELPTGEEPDTPLEACIPSTDVISKKLLTLGDTVVYLTRFDEAKAKANDEKRKLTDDNYRPELAHEVEGHGHDNHGPIEAVKLPLVDVAVIKTDPFKGCEALTPSLMTQRLPSNFPQKHRQAVYQAFWLARFEIVEDEFNTTAQSWLNTVTHHLGFGSYTLGDDDIAALKHLKMKLPEWYSKDVTFVERQKLFRDIVNKKGNKYGQIPIDHSKFK